MHPGDHSCALGYVGPFPCAIVVVGFISVRSFNFVMPWGTVRSIPVSPGDRSGWSIPVRSRGLRVRSGAFGSFACALAVIGFVRERSVHSSWSSGSLVVVPFPSAMGFARASSVHSRAK